MGALGLLTLRSDGLCLLTHSKRVFGSPVSFNASWRGGSRNKNRTQPLKGER